MIEWLIALALALATPAAPAAPAPITQAQADAAIGTVLPQLEAIRGLSFKTKVPVEVIDVARARAYALARFEAVTPPSKVAADQKAYELLGLIPSGTNVLKTLLDVLEEQAGGFYDPRTKRYYLLDDMPREMAAAFTAHEMTHALEDQYYDIDARLAKVVDDDDATFALSSVAEGSASLAMTIYMVRGISSGTMSAADLTALQNSEAGRAKRLDAMPGVLRKELLGPYMLGALFLSRGNASAAARAFPKDDVDRAWRSPPRSSEQILHPEKYWDPARRDEPIAVTVPDASAVLGAGWTHAGHGVLGEISIGGLVGAPSPQSHDEAALLAASAWTNAAASGWGGDRWELWTKGPSAVVLLRTVWDTPQDAVEFEHALPARIGFAYEREGSVVGIVAGEAGEKARALLDLSAGAAKPPS